MDIHLHMFEGSLEDTTGPFNCDHSLPGLDGDTVGDFDILGGVDNPHAELYLPEKLGNINYQNKNTRITFELTACKKKFNNMEDKI